MQKRRKAVLLINVGTPDKAEVKAVRRYLMQFLNDRRVMDMPWLLRKILVNLIIVPFRAPKSVKLYQTKAVDTGRLSAVVKYGKICHQPAICFGRRLPGFYRHALWKSLTEKGIATD